MGLRIVLERSVPSRMCLFRHQIRSRVEQGAVMSTPSDILYPQDEKDKISKLPDDILLDVLLILDLKHAAQTSILAKRWKFLWTRLTDLNLHPSDAPFKNKFTMVIPATEPLYVNWINQVIDAHHGPCITKCRVFFRPPNPSCTHQRHFEKWARFALSKKVTDLDLDFSATPTSACLSLGCDILKHPPYYDTIVNLKSLRLRFVDISGEALEFILSQCRVLERLYVSCSKTLETLNIVSYKLKHLTLITCVWLKELQIDAVNLISFHHDKAMFTDPSAHIVFKCVPKLVDLSLAGKICRYPFCLLGQISCLFNQVTSLSLFLHVGPDYGDFVNCSDVRLGFDVLFPNAKQLTLTVGYLVPRAVIFIKFFINACPVLQELKLQIINLLILNFTCNRMFFLELLDSVSSLSVPSE